MDCEQIRSLMAEYALGDKGLSPCAKVDIDLHLRGCCDCALEYRTLKRVVAAIQGLPLDQLAQSLGLVVEDKKAEPRFTDLAELAGRT